MTQPPSVQYIQVKDAFGVQWLMNPDTQLKSKRPEDAKAFCAVEAQKVFTDLTRLGFKGLAIVDELPSDRKMANHSTVNKSAMVQCIECFKAEKANAAQKGLVILPSVDGPYVFDPTTDKVIGRKGGEGYRMAVSSMTKKQFLELQSVAESLCSKFQR